MYGGIQVNFCKTSYCGNFGIVAVATRPTRNAFNPSGRYIIIIAKMKKEARVGMFRMQQKWLFLEP